MRSFTLCAGFRWLHITSLEIAPPAVKEVSKFTRKYVSRVGDRKDAVVFDCHGKK